MRRFGLFGAVVALVTAQTASAATLNAPARHIDPLLSLSLLASNNARAIVCQKGAASGGATVATTAGNCALPQNNGGTADPDSSEFARHAGEHSGWGSALPFGLLGLAAVVGLVVVLSGSGHSGRPVSPS